MEQPRIVPGGSKFQWILKSTCLIFHTFLYPPKKNDCFDIILMETRIVTCFNLLRYQVISILLFWQWNYPRPSIPKAGTTNVKSPISKEGAEISLNFLTIDQGGVDLAVWAILISKESSNRILIQVV